GRGPMPVQIRYKLVELMREWEQMYGYHEGWLTYKKLSDMSGVHAITLNKIANNKTSQIEHETLRKILEFFNCQIGDLIETAIEAPHE
ncbi:MAG TPA: helix-turn-helix transcriptional regulator, partial [Roseiflexaceae bacterium]|nr:helix-turn-helix transcriptional regulator [Roseiflexaceae bacterium]